MLIAISHAMELLLIVLASTLFIEVLLWLWAYRNFGFKSLKSQVEKQGRKLDSLKSASQPYSKQKTKARKFDRIELHLKSEVTRQLASLRLKQTVVMGGSLFLLFRQLSYRYDGMVLAKLPFEPPAILRKLSQRGLEDPAVYDCAFVFLYALLNMSVRPNISKLLDLGPSRRMLAMASAWPNEKQQ